MESSPRVPISPSSPAVPLMKLNGPPLLTVVVLPKSSKTKSMSSAVKILLRIATSTKVSPPLLPFPSTETVVLPPLSTARTKSLMLATVNVLSMKATRSSWSNPREKSVTISTLPSLANTNVSEPNPPVKVSVPASPAMRSSSLPPSMVSSSLPPNRVSAPSPPVIVSLPASPNTRSWPSSPRRSSSPAPPRIRSAPPRP